MNLLIGTRKGLVNYQYTKGDWRCVGDSFRAMPVNYAMSDARTGTLWACLDHGHWGPKLHRSKDRGGTWEEVTTPVFPEGTLRGDGQPATVSYLWYITPGGADQPDRVYVGTEPGGLFQSDDGGNSFHLVETLWNRPEREKWWMGGGRDHPGVCSIVVDPRDSSHVLIGISVGGVYETRDDGQTWEARNKGLQACYLPDPASEFGHDPHFMIASPPNPDVIWQQNHCGIFRTSDSGKTWNAISSPPAYFGFALAVDAQDERTAWVVPAIDAEYRMAVDAKLCVCRTDDGGKTWTDYRAGLPQDNAYDVIFRHALDVRGDTLVFGTTTGNLYISDDRGESWRCLSHNLAPVYSVRFAD